MLTRDQILAATTLKTEVVEVPEWGGDVLVSAMTGTARDAWEQSIVSKGGGIENVRAKLVAATLVDTDGMPLFTAKDIAALGRLSSAALDRVAKVAQRLNGLTADDLEDAKGN